MHALFLKDKCRLERLKQILKVDNEENAQILDSKVEEEWCSFHYLVQPALHQVTETCMASLSIDISF